MRHLAMCLLAMALGLDASAFEITCDAVIAATNLGATAPAMVARIADPSNRVAPVTGADLERLRSAGVPDEVIRALLARSTVPTPTLTSPPAKAPTPILSPVPTALSAPVALAEVVVDGVLLMQATHLGKNRPGSVRFAGEGIAWQDGADSQWGFVVPETAITRAWMRCRAVGESKFCYEFDFENAKGETFRFQDATAAAGADDRVVRIRQAFAEQFPHLEVGERIER